MSIFLQSLVMHVRVILLTHITWSPMRRSTRDFFKILSLELFHCLNNRQELPELLCRESWWTEISGTFRTKNRGRP